MNVANNPRCMFCDTENETIVHFFVIVKKLENCGTNSQSG